MFEAALAGEISYGKNMRVRRLIQQIVVELTVQFGTISLVQGVNENVDDDVLSSSSVVLLNGTRPNRTSRVLFRGTLDSVNRALDGCVFHPRLNWNSHVFLEGKRFGRLVGLHNARRAGADTIRLVVNGTEPTLIESSSHHDVLGTPSDPYSSPISQESFATEDLLFFVSPVNDEPVLVLPTQITHLHQWHRYSDGISNTIVSVDVIDTLEDKPVALEGMSVRDVDAAVAEDGHGSIIVTV